jgi:hypothetical protein
MQRKEQINMKAKKSKTLSLLANKSHFEKEHN